MLCPIIFNSNTIEFTMHTSCFCGLMFTVLALGPKARQIVLNDFGKARNMPKNYCRFSHLIKTEEVESAAQGPDIS